MSADISIIVPVFNAGKYLRQCVDSIIAQTIFNRMEIILVDDGSTDDSPEICDEYAVNMDNISVIHQDNAGVSAARNAGVEKATGEFIGFVDSDDYIFPGMYEKLLNAAESNKADMSFCDYIFCFPECERVISFPFPADKALDMAYIREVICLFMLKDASLNCCWNKLFRRDLIERLSIDFPVGRTIGEDRLFTIEYFSHCSVVCYAPIAGYYYRFVSNSTTKAPRKQMVDDIIREYKEDMAIFEALGINKEKIKDAGELKLLEQAVAAIYLAIENLNGQDRLAALKDVVFNSDVRECLHRQWDGLMQNCSRSEKIIYHLIGRKNIQGLIALMRLMKIKNSLRRGITK